MKLTTCAAAARRCPRPVPSAHSGAQVGLHERVLRQHVPRDPRLLRPRPLQVSRPVLCRSLTSHSLQRPLSFFVSIPVAPFVIGLGYLCIILAFAVNSVALNAARDVGGAFALAAIESGSSADALLTQAASLAVSSTARSASPPTRATPRSPRSRPSPRRSSARSSTRCSSPTRPA